MQITGTLRKNDLDRWEIVDQTGRRLELSSGSCCEVQIGGNWIATRIEYDHDRREYYAVDDGVQLCRGLPARLRL